MQLALATALLNISRAILQILQLVMHITFGCDEELMWFGDLDPIFKFNIAHKLPINAIIMCLYVWENQAIQNRAIKDQSFL